MPRNQPDTIIQKYKRKSSKKKLTHEQIDQIIINNIDEATADNSSIWTCPDFNRREYVHSFFQYPAMMIPAVQKKLIEIITEARPDIQNMIDPFIGSATTMVACMETGLDCYGQDINPLAVLIARTRTGPYFVNVVSQKYEELIIRVSEDKSKKIEAKFAGINKWFKPSIQIQLSRLVRGIRQEANPAIRRFFWVILGETVRLTSNDRTSTFKLHIRTKEEIAERNFSAIDVFILHMDKSIEDYIAHADLLFENDQLIGGYYKAKIDIKLWNSSKKIYNPSNKPFYDLLVTSPPYGDNKTTVTYGQHSYLPLQWIDKKDIDSKVNNDFLKSTSEIDTRSLGGKISKIDQSKLKTLLKMSPTFRRTYTLLEHLAPTKEKKVAAFMLDLNQTITNILRVMKPNSYQIWTVGNRRVGGIQIPNDKIIQELIESNGGKLIKKLEREILKKRMATRNKESALMTTEDILIFRKVN